MSKQHPEVDLSLKIYLDHVKVTSCAMTGFVCTKKRMWNHRLSCGRYVFMLFFPTNLGQHMWELLSWWNKKLIAFRSALSPRLFYLILNLPSNRLWSWAFQPLINVHCILKVHLYSVSRRNATFWSKVGEHRSISEIRRYPLWAFGYFR